MGIERSTLVILHLLDDVKEEKTDVSTTIESIGDPISIKEGMCTYLIITMSL